MDSGTAQRLLDLNRRFYTEHGRDFSATRQRLQPGVKRIVGTLRGKEAILDIGCGNGELARDLSRRGQRGSYLGLDFSQPLLEAAECEPFAFPVKFQMTDLTSLRVESALLPAAFFDDVFAFAVLHHIPTAGLRIDLVRKVNQLLKPGGRFIHSNWQFLTSPRMAARIQPWRTLGLTEQDVDPGDYLIDWKRGGEGLRYLHHFDLSELDQLAEAGGFKILETFHSDGQNRVSSLYQIWEKTGGA